MDCPAPASFLIQNNLRYRYRAVSVPLAEHPPGNCHSVAILFTLNANFLLIKRRDDSMLAFTFFFKYERSFVDNSKETSYVFDDFFFSPITLNSLLGVYERNCSRELVERLIN